MKKIPAYFWNAAFPKDGRKLALFGGLGLNQVGGDVDDVKSGVFLYKLKP